MTMDERPSKVGTEHEFSINDRSFRPLPINDRIIERLQGSIHNEVPFSGICISKELQKHAFELKPLGPHTNLRSMERKLHIGLLHLYEALDGDYRFLGLGMHPTLSLDMTTYWDHEEKEVFEAYDRLFDIRQHGWLNIQALQVNLPYQGPDDLVCKYNRIRALIPYLVALTAASPFVEGSVTGHMDNRIRFYRENQRRLPSICNAIIPERLSNMDEYFVKQEGIYQELRGLDADVLCNEWVNSTGVIIRASRRCLEIKALDEQECLHSDMAVTALIRALLRVKDLSLEEDRDALLSLLSVASEKGVGPLGPELGRLLDRAVPVFPKEDQVFIPFLRRRVEGGSLAEIICANHGRDKEILPLLSRLEECLLQNTSYYGPE